jgi:hypothetical protein
MDFGNSDSFSLLPWSIEDHLHIDPDYHCMRCLKFLPIIFGPSGVGSISSDQPERKIAVRRSASSTMTVLTQTHFPLGRGLIENDAERI